MTGVTIAVCATQPRLADLVTALAEADPTLRVLHDQERAVLVLAARGTPRDHRRGASSGPGAGRGQPTARPDDAAGGRTRMVGPLPLRGW